MSNLEIHASLINGDIFPMHENGDPCELFIANFLADDLRPPPTSLQININTKSGKNIRIHIPNGTSEALVFVNEEQV